MTKMTFTKNELAMLDNIARSEYTMLNGARPTTFDDIRDGTWTFDVGHGFKTTSIPGIVSSLVKKGLVWSHDNTERAPNPSNASVGMTEAGFAAWKWHDDNPINTGSNTVASHTDRF